MMYTDNELNERLIATLKCSNCSHYLTPPVKYCGKQHQVCGKCMPETNTCPVCDEEWSPLPYILENIVALLYFPCKYKESGCQERCKWDKLIEHEIECDLRVYDCPLNLLKNCLWTGKGSSLKNHFEIEHNDLVHVVNDGKYNIPVDLSNRSHDIWLLMALQEAFLLHRLITDNSVLFAVQYIGSKKDRLKYEYKLDFTKPETKTILCSSSDVMSDAVKVLTTKNALEMPVPLLQQFCVKEEQSVIGNLVIIDKEARGAPMSSDMMDKLKCPVCLELMKKIICLCEMGHSFCFDCRTLVENCPMCRSPILRNARNYSLELICQNVAL